MKFEFITSFHSLIASQAVIFYYRQCLYVYGILSPINSVKIGGHSKSAANFVHAVTFAVLSCFAGAILIEEFHYAIPRITQSYIISYVGP